MADVGSLLVVLLLAVLLIAGLLVGVSLWRSERKSKGLYGFLLACEAAWLLILEHLFALVGVPGAWQDGAAGVLFAVMVATLVLLYRHRHDPDPDEP